MPVFNFLLCIDTNICAFGHHHGTALSKTNHLFDLEGGREGQMMRAEVAPLYFDDCVSLCWFEELVKLWSGIPSSQGILLDCKVVFVEGLEFCWRCLSGSGSGQTVPFHSCFSPSSSVSAAVPVQLLLVLLEISSAKHSFHFFNLIP